VAEVEHDDSLMTVQERSEAGIFRGQKFRFDDRLLFGPDSTNEEVFNQLAASMLPRVLQGYNATILAYGQTGSGKTHSITGTEDELGLLPSAL